MKKILFSLLMPLFFLSCSMKSKEDFEAQGKAHLDRLNLELKSIHDLQELKAHQKHLKKRFNQLTQVMVQYYSFLEAHPELSKSPEDDMVLSAAQLKEELSRLLEIEGAEDVIIEAQKEASLKLSFLQAPL